MLCRAISKISLQCIVYCSMAAMCLQAFQEDCACHTGVVVELAGRWLQVLCCWISLTSTGLGSNMLC
jgi:hypothetical protein